MSHFVEIRSYNLKPGTRDRLHQIMCEQALPMLARWGVDVVALIENYTSVVVEADDAMLEGLRG